MSDDLQPIIQDPLVRFGCDVSFAPGNYSVVIIDEGDKWMENYAVVYDQKQLKGLFQFRKGIKIIVMTATYTSFMRGMLGDLPEVFQPATFLEKFTARVCISNDIRKPYRIDYQAFIDSRRQEAAFVQLLQSKMMQGPVIVFCEGDETILADKIKPICDSMGIEIWCLSTLEKAKQIRKHTKDRTLGVWVMSKELDRGFDIKLSSDAYVIIKPETKGFTHTEVRQMVGRGSRTFGQSVGAYLTYEFGLTSQCIEKLLKDKEQEGSDNYQLVLMLYRGWKHIPASYITTVIEAMKDGGWNMKVHDFDTKHRAVYSILMQASGYAKKQ